jgi:hypothetical protein
VRARLHQGNEGLYLICLSFVSLSPTANNQARDCNNDTSTYAISISQEAFASRKLSKTTFKMPSEAENINYLYLVLTNDGTPVVSPTVSSWKKKYERRLLSLFN